MRKQTNANYFLLIFNFKLQQIQPSAADLSELQQSTSDQRHLQQTYQRMQQQLISKNKATILSNAQNVC